MKKKEIGQRRRRYEKSQFRPKEVKDNKDTLPPRPPPLPSVLPPAPDLPRLLVPEVRVLVQRLKICEQHLQHSSQNQEDVEVTRSALRRTCVELINAYPRTAKKLNINERLWRSWYREIEGQLPSVLMSCSVFYSSLVEQLQSSLRGQNRLPDQLDGLKYSVQQSLLALGDVTRYEQHRLKKGKSRDWAATRQYYQQALEVAPSNGKAYNQLGLLAVLEGKLVDGAYYYARSLVCENPFPASCNFLHVLQRGSTAKPKPYQVVSEPERDALEIFSACLLSCLHIIVVGGKFHSEWNIALKSTEVSLAHLLKVYDQQDETLPIDGPLLARLSSTLLRTMCLIIVSTHYSQLTFKKATSREELDIAFDNWAGSEVAVQSLAVGIMIMACLLSKLTAVVATSAESTRTKYFANALLPAVNLFLDWFNLHPAFLQQVSLSAAETLKDGCIALFRTLACHEFVERSLCCKEKRECDLSNAFLPEDHELHGFLPYQKALEKRYSKKLNQKPARQLTEEDHLVLRVTRFMTSSERYVIPTAIPIESLDKLLTFQKSAIVSPNPSFNVSDMVAKMDSLKINPRRSSYLCVVCSNTSAFVDDSCEFCGYKDDVSTGWSQECDVPYSNDSFSSDRRLTSSRSPPYCCSPSDPSASSTSDFIKNVSLPINFKTIMTIGAEHTKICHDRYPNGNNQQCLIVIDAPNVAMRHGKGKLFSCKGIELAVKYFETLGHRVVAFISDYMLQSEVERAEREKEGEVMTIAKIPDDVALLERLVHEGVLIPTPPQDYDDSYCIQYAGLHNGYIVTNDFYRDHIMNMEGPVERKVAMRAWLRAHQISYSWVGNEFLPNPNSRFVKAYGTFHLPTRCMLRREIKR